MTIAEAAEGSGISEESVARSCVKVSVSTESRSCCWLL